MNSKYKVLDLFAGAGGLSLGFLLTNHFRITTAVENNKIMQKTYVRNHPGVTMLNDVLEFNNFDDFKKKYGPFDVVIGGPPCQGFSIANKQHNQMININNLLVKQYVNFILGLKPKAFVMENVKNLNSDKQYYFLTKDEVNNSVFATYIRNTKDIEINIPKRLIDEYYDNESFNIPQIDFLSLKKQVHLFDRGGKLESIESFKKSIRNILIPNSEALWKSLSNIVEKYSLPDKNANSELFSEINWLSMISELKKHNTFISRINYNGNVAKLYCKAIKVTDYIQAKLSPHYQYESRIYNTALFGVPQLRERFVIIGKRNDVKSPIFLPKETHTLQTALSVRNAIEDLERITPSDSAHSTETVVNIGKPSHKYPWNDSSIIHNNLIPKTGPVAMERFKSISQGENFHSLPESLKKTYSNPSKTQQSIYKRLKYDEPSNTVTNVRKCMWIHPVFDRGISVREAARLQSFPDSFIFEGDKDKQYQQVGNAVPPLFAKAIAEAIYQILKHD